VFPRAVLFDMDDTLISAYRQPELAWAAILAEFEADLPAWDVTAAVQAISAAAERFWADESRHRSGRLNLLDARAGIIREGFTALGGTIPGDDVLRRISARYDSYRNEQMYLFPYAHEVVDTMRAAGVKLALITNGAAKPQRAKVDRFELTDRFHHIQIEGEHGFGKPEERAYRHALSVLGVEAHETWMVGDNLEWEVVAPQRLGIHAIWHDSLGNGLPDGHHARPDRIIRCLSELLAPIASADMIQPDVQDARAVREPTERE
jgi:putative hydrolase of the HAD superfamily